MKQLFIASTLISIVCSLSPSCKKNSCQPMSTGRIIGYNPCRNFMNYGKVEGAGFVIEIDNGATKDTVATYGVPDNLFSFQSSYIDGSYSSFLFRPQIQEQLRFKFNYQYVADNQKTYPICNGMVNTAPYDAAVKNKEVFLTCVSK